MDFDATIQHRRLAKFTGILRLLAVCGCVYNQTSNAEESVLRKGPEFFVDVIVR